MRAQRVPAPGLNGRPHGSGAARGAPPGTPTAQNLRAAAVARLMGDPARAAMLDALMAGEALTAGELATVAGVSPSTATAHLTRLRDGGLIEVVSAGRHRYHRLASPQVAHALEALSLLHQDPPVTPVRSLRASRAAEAMLLARTCYDHLAGRLGVAVHDALVRQGTLVAGGDGYLVTERGADLFAGLGVDVAAVRASRRSFAIPCLDFSERRPHLAGALGAAVCGRMLEMGWLVRRVPGQRPLRLTGAGRAGLESALAVRVPAPGGDSGPGR